MKGARIKRSDIILVGGAICVTLLSPLILCALFAIDLQVCAITYLLCAEVDPSGTDPFSRSARIVTLSSQERNDMS